MKKIKNPILDKVLFPPVGVVILLVIATCIALPVVFIKGYDTHVFGYIVFGVSFYALTVATLYCIFFLPKVSKEIKSKIYQIPFGKKFFSNVVFRSKVLLNVTFIINCLYVGLNVYLFYRNSSYWFLVLAVYYMILGIMRAIILRYTLKNTLTENVVSEWRIARSCSVILTLINLFLSSAVLMILFTDNGFNYNGLFIYVVALYTFYLITQSIINVIKYRKFTSPVLSVAKVVSLTSAMVSMLSLETAMLTQFGADMATKEKNILIAATGGVISVIIVIMSIYVITKANKNIKLYK